MPSSDVQEGAILYALHQGSLVPVASDASGNLTAVIKGLDGVTLRTIKVDSGGQLFALIHGRFGANFIPIATNAAGEMITRIFGSDPTAPVRTNAAGELIARMMGASGNMADFDTLGALLVRQMGWDGSAYRRQPLIWGYSGTFRSNVVGTAATAGTYDLDGGLVPPNNVAVVTSLWSWQTSGIQRVGALMVVLGGLLHVLKKETPTAITYPITKEGQWILRDNDSVKARFYGTAVGEAFEMGCSGYLLSLAQ